MGQTWDPEAEPKYLAGVAHESQVVYPKLQEKLSDQGVLFYEMDWSSASTSSSGSSTSGRSFIRTTTDLRRTGRIG